LGQKLFLQKNRFLSTTHAPKALASPAPAPQNTVRHAQDVPLTPTPPTKAPGVTGIIISTVVFNFIVYLLIGLPLAVFPGLVHFKLGYSAAIAGLLISLQYAATLITRSVVGRISDERGPKTVVLAGLGCAAISGGCILAASFSHAPLLILGLLALSRLWLGAAESGTGTGCIAWGIGQTGPAHTAQAISWNGVASYGGIALGAPVGVALAQAGGIRELGIATAGLALAGLAAATFKRGTPVLGGVPLALSKVFGHVLPFGLTLALGSVGLGTMVAFITLDYASHRWTGAAYALSGFGLAFVAVRILGGQAIHRFGGFDCALVSFAVEGVGLVLLWAAPSPAIALLGAVLTGAGLSLIFPAMAVEALIGIPTANRGSAIGLYTVFLDVSLGATGPGAGLVIGRFGYGAVYLLGAGAVAVAVVITLRLKNRSSKTLLFVNKN
jgi:predicted MFS family arabinose efflux permease